MRWRRRRRSLGQALLRGLPYASIPTILVGIPVVAVTTSLFYMGWVGAKTLLGRGDGPGGDIYGV